MEKAAGREETKGSTAGASTRLPIVRSRYSLAAATTTLAALAVALLAVTVLHELGHDEAQAWNIARASAWPWDVLDTGRYEGHTPFWHLVLWPLALTGDPRLMQWLAAGLSFGAAVLLLRDRPFPLVVCALLVLGYYPFYQYGVVPRPYTLALALAAVIGSTLYRGAGSFELRALLCGLLAFTSAFGVAMSAGPMLLVLTEAWRRGGARANLALLPGVALYAGLVLAAVYLVVFPAHSTTLESAIVTGNRVSARAFIHVLESAAFPQYDRLPFGIGAWLGHDVLGRFVAGGLAYAVIVAVAIHLRSRPAAVLAWIVSVAGVGYAGLYSGFVAERYAGHLFLAALALCWARDGLRADNVVADGFFRGVRRPSPLVTRRLSRLAGAGLAGVLLFHAVIGLGAVGLDIRHEQSPWRRMAADLRALRAGEGDAFRIVASYGYDAGALSAYLDEPVYDLRCECWRRYTDWTRDRAFDPDATAEAIRALEREHGPTVSIITRKAWTPQADEGFCEIADYPPGYRDDGDFTIRLYRSKGVPERPC